MGTGVVLALDIGEKRIGVAVSDPNRIIARPLTVIQRASRVQDFAAIARLAQEHNAALILCGYPLSLDGSEGPQGQRIRRYAEALAQSLATPVELWDETYSTTEADSIMQTTRKRMTPQDRRKWIDAVAAAVILQSFLESRATNGPTGDFAP